MIRLQKYLAKQLGVSRRKAEEMITAGKILLNGKSDIPLGTKVDPEKDQVEYQDQKLDTPRSLSYLVFHKPVGVLSTRKDTHDRKTIMDFLPPDLQHVFPVGRLDKDSQGLIFLTNDGDFTYQITHPKFECEKVYIVKTLPGWTKEELQQLQKPLLIDGETYCIKNFQQFLQTKQASFFRITLAEGKKREIRNICKYFRHPVLTLKRIRIGNIHLGNLPEGRWRFFSSLELQSLSSLFSSGVPSYPAE